MKKFFLSFLFLLILVCVTASSILYQAGMPYVDYALKRGSNGNPLSPPMAFEDIYPFPNKFPENQAKAPDFNRAEWTISSFDGLKLSGTHFMPAGKSHRWAIVVHGYGCNQRFVWDIADAFLHQGYHVLTPDMRASGKSEGTYITMGVLEGKDVARWARSIAVEDPEAKIVLYGVSLGAVDVMMSLQENLPDQVKVVVEDSGFSNLENFLEFRMDKMQWRYRKVILAAANILMKIRTGVFMTEANPEKAVAGSTLPILFIHGINDRLIPIRMMYELAENSPAAAKEILSVQTEGHAVNEFLGRPYYDAVFQFIENHLS
jgi:fermentation-respiration switch protein FrsA (DUF1100 family)